MKRFDRTLQVLGIAFILLAAATPFLRGSDLFLLTLAVNSALVVLGLLLLMRTGLVSFGQGLYACIGGYAAGMLGEWLHVTDGVIMLGVGAVVAAVIAGIVGILLANYRGIFFAMLTLALSMILWGLLSRTPALGGTDGFNVGIQTLAGISMAVHPSRILFLASLVVALICTAGMHLYLNSHFGRLAPAVRDNELRVEYMGASVRNVVHVNYIIAAVVAALGGGLTALAVGHIDPEASYWIASGDYVFVAILAGTSSVLAPFLGSVIFEELRSHAVRAAPNTWHMIVGATMLVIIMFLPGGLWSIFTGIAARLRRRGNGTTLAARVPAGEASGKAG